MTATAPTWHIFKDQYKCFVLRNACRGTTSGSVITHRLRNACWTQYVPGKAWLGANSCLIYMLCSFISLHSEDYPPLLLLVIICLSLADLVLYLFFFWALSYQEPFKYRMFETHIDNSFQNILWHERLDWAWVWLWD